jgi:hypothetical protein
VADAVVASPAGFSRKNAKRRPKRPIRENLERGDSGTPKFKAPMLEADLADMTPAQPKLCFSDKPGNM